MAEIVSQHNKSEKLQIRYHLTCKYIKWKSIILPSAQGNTKCLIPFYLTAASGEITKT